MSLVIGDPVTFAYLGRTRLVFAHVERFARGEIYVAAEEPVPPEQTRALMLTNEGTTWVRGHHSADTVEGQSLLAACALYVSSFGETNLK